MKNLSHSAVDSILLVLIARAESAAKDIEDACLELARGNNGADSYERLARYMRYYDKAVATILDVVGGHSDYDAMNAFLKEYPRLNKTACTLASEAMRRAFA